MKNAIIFHGTGGSPDSFWHPYLKTELEKRGFHVWVPALPDTDTPDLATWLPMALKGIYTNETTLVGHSAGCPLILSILEHIDVKISKAIFVSGYARNLWKKGNLKILQQVYDWKKIKAHVEDAYYINSDNDPWGCNDIEGKYLFDNLGGTQIIKHGAGHMGSVSFNQPYKEFPLLVKLIE